MPYDYLWSEEEISKGNGLVIRNLLKQIKNAYSYYEFEKGNSKSKNKC